AQEPPMEEETERVQEPQEWRTPRRTRPSESTEQSSYELTKTVAARKKSLHGSVPGMSQKPGAQKHMFIHHLD
ncbi:hypothetical protein STEG23_002319, partial [Scotinomys teguina]